LPRLNLEEAISKQIEEIPFTFRDIEKWKTYNIWK